MTTCGFKIGIIGEVIRQGNGRVLVISDPKPKIDPLTLISLAIADTDINILIKNLESQQEYLLTLERCFNLMHLQTVRHHGMRRI